MRDEVRKRVKLNVWGILYGCKASRAIQTDVVSEQSSEGFLLAYHRFASLRGYLRKLWSDLGFVGVKRVLENLQRFLNQLNKAELEEEAAKHGKE